ncbi:hypothetical protein EWM62_15050 [Mucilaginibacter terrigena]|uniref:Cardiolipin synthase N-terminal domain-containing protein n=1 Tax=Mucilaginibacter terrigena TaxID=2492395 RepID=A0A4Q5LJQ9_9SPHI|nr:PLDc N-terminal domain-containing protein [Mucilaginibacter terrigena]RYU89628.1 hypothetical protein EWM62_15050 [Mucilaginibacter terrigena]
MSCLLFLNVDTVGIFIILFLVVAYFGLIIFSLLDAVRSTFKNPGAKVIWVLFILFAPFLGSILYLTLGRNSRI